MDRETSYMTTSAYKPKGDEPSMFLEAGVALNHSRL